MWLEGRYKSTLSTHGPRGRSRNRELHLLNNQTIPCGRACSLASSKIPLQKQGVITPGGPGSRLLLGAGIGVGPRMPQDAAVSPVSVDGLLGAQLSCPCRARRCRAGSAADAAGRTNLGRSCGFGMAFTCLTKASSTGKTKETRWQAVHTHRSGGAAWRAAVARHNRLRVLIGSCFLN